MIENLTKNVKNSIEEDTDTSNYTQHYICWYACQHNFSHLCTRPHSDFIKGHARGNSMYITAQLVSICGNRVLYNRWFLLVHKPHCIVIKELNRVDIKTLNSSSIDRYSWGTLSDSLWVYSSSAECFGLGIESVKRQVQSKSIETRTDESGNSWPQSCIDALTVSYSSWTIWVKPETKVTLVAPIIPAHRNSNAILHDPAEVCINCSIRWIRGNTKVAVHIGLQIDHRNSSPLWAIIGEES